MAGGKVVQLAEVAFDARRKPKAEPLDERRMGLDRFPIWVHVGDAEQARSVARSIHRELGKAGFICDGDLQTDPHDGLKIEGAFEVFLKDGEKRQPEHVGIVTLFTDAQGKSVIKMNPSYPEACNNFRSAISGALSALISGSPGGKPADTEITIRQQNCYEPLGSGDSGPEAA